MTKDERLLIAIDAELKSKLQAAADLEGISMSEMVRRLIAGSVNWDTGKVTWKES